MKRVQWEYMSLISPSPTELRKAGEEFWELVSVTAVQNDGTTLYFYFKRPKK